MNPYSKAPARLRNPLFDALDAARERQAAELAAARERLRRDDPTNLEKILRLGNPVPGRDARRRRTRDVDLSQSR